MSYQARSMWHTLVLGLLSVLCTLGQELLGLRKMGQELL